MNFNSLEAMDSKSKPEKYYATPPKRIPKSPENYSQFPQAKRNSTRNKSTNSKPYLNDSDLLYRTEIARKNQKNISLNHLLNFSFPARQKALINAKKLQHSFFNKERFVNAK
jgi:hypothetical protein